MITTILDYVNGNTLVYEFRGLSTDTKPVEKVTNGSIFVEMDKSDVYMFDAVSKTWKKL